MNRFRQDNTEGYSDAELIKLNEAFDAELVKLNEAFESLKSVGAGYLEGMGYLARKSYENYLAERVRSAFDSRYGVHV